MAKKPKVEEASRPGRKCFGDEKMGTGTFRRSQEQADKLCVLGGSEWLREQIDNAPWPRGTKPAK